MPTSVVARSDTTSGSVSGTWRLRSWLLPGLGLEALPIGCGLSGDDTNLSSSSWLVLWHGSLVAWARKPPSSEEADASRGNELSNSFAVLPESSLVARPIPTIDAVAVVLASGRLALLHCDATVAESQLQFFDNGTADDPPYRAADVWPLGETGLLVLSDKGWLRAVPWNQDGELYLEDRAASAERGLSRQSDVEMEVVSTAAMSIVDSGGSKENATVGNPEVLVAVAGMCGTASTVRFWELQGFEVQSFHELVVPATTKEVAPRNAVEEIVANKTTAIALMPSIGRICALCADGSITIFAKTSLWFIQTQLSAHYVAGLRLCSSAHLDLAVLEQETVAGEPAAVAGALHVWADGTLGLLFPGTQHPDGAQPAPEMVNLNVEGIKPTLAQESHRMIGVLPMPCGEKGTAKCLTRFLTFCSAGNHLNFLVVQEDVNAGRTIGNVFAELSQMPRPSSVLETRSSRAPSVEHTATLQEFGAIMGINDLPLFAEKALKFDPFANRGLTSTSKAMSSRSVAFGCEQVQRLLETAKIRLEYVLEVCGSSKAKTASSNTAAAAGAGWDDFDFDFDEDAEQLNGAGATPENCAAGEGLPLEELARLTTLLERVELQLGRLKVFKQLQGSDSEHASISLTWANFRETEERSLRRQACQMAAEQCVPVLEALFSQQSEAMMPHWQSILNALPETTPTRAVRNILPGGDGFVRVSPNDAVDWYVLRAQQIIDRTGMCGFALDLLQHAIYVVAANPQENLRRTESTLSNRESNLCDFAKAAFLPRISEEVAQSCPKVLHLYSAFRLCAEYGVYCRTATQFLYARRQSGKDALTNDSFCPFSSGVMDLASFCALDPPQRAQLVFRNSSPTSIAETVHTWTSQVRVKHCIASIGHQAPAMSDRTEAEQGARVELVDAASVVANAFIEEENIIMESLLGCLNSSGWDPACFLMVANVVHASNPTLKPEERIIRNSLTLLEFIIGAVYSDDQRCQAIDIFESVDLMYGCIPRKDAYNDTQHNVKWNRLQDQADELEQHLTCVEVLKKHNIHMSSSFADLRRGCTNESIAIRSLWNLFRVLGGKFRPAVFWLKFKDEFLHLHKYAFAAVSSASAYEMYMRCLAEQEHWEVMSTLASDWAGPEVAGSLVALAQEFVNSSPALKHSSLEKAKRILKCVPQADKELAGLAQAEVDFIKACELLHALVRFQPKHSAASKWVEELTSMNPLASLSQVASRQRGSAEPEVTTGDSSAAAASNQKASTGGTAWGEGFPIDSPVQVRLQLHQPLRIVTDLLEYNPPVMLESEELHNFFSLLGIGPASPCWGEVMAMCAAAQILHGSRSEALSLVEKLVTNAHPVAWKLALALAFGSSSTGSEKELLNLDHGSDLLADAIKVCPEGELGNLLSYFAQGPLASADILETEATPISKESVFVSRRGYVIDDIQTTGLGSWTKHKLGLEDEAAEDTSPNENDTTCWRTMPLWENENSDWARLSALQNKGELIMSADVDTGVALLDKAGALPSTGLPKAEKQNLKISGRPVVRSSANKVKSTIPSSQTLGHVATSRDPRHALDSLSRAAEAPAPRQALDSLASSSPAPRQALDSLARATASPAPRQALDSLASGSSGAPDPRRALDGLARATASPAPRQALDSLASGSSGAPDPRRALDGLAQESGQQPAPRNALDNLARASESSKSKWSFGGLAGGLAGGLRSWMASSEAPPELGGEAEEDTSSQIPSAPTETPKASVRSMASTINRAHTRSMASQLLQRHADKAEDTDGFESLDCQVLLSSLDSLSKKCPRLDFSKHGGSLVDEVLKCVDVDSAPELIHAVTGVDALNRRGVTASAIALHAAKLQLQKHKDDSESDTRLSSLLHWLSPADAADLLCTAMLSESKLPLVKQMEIISQLREVSSFLTQIGPYGEQQLAEVLRQADTLCLLRTVYQNTNAASPSLPLCLDAEGSAKVVGSRWIQTLRSDPRTQFFADTAVNILEERGLQL